MPPRPRFRPTRRILPRPLDPVQIASAIRPLRWPHLHRAPDPSANDGNVVRLVLERPPGDLCRRADEVFDPHALATSPGGAYSICVTRKLLYANH
jgi:hypothetical protein